MNLSIGVGVSREKEGFAAGCEAAQQAIAQIGQTRADLALVFATIGYNQEDLLAGIRTITGDTPLSGCSGEGIITQAGSDEGTYAVSVMLLASDQITFDTFLVEGLKKESKEAGLRLSDALGECKNGKVLLLFPDGLTINSTQFLHALESHLPYPIKIAGGTSGDNFKFAKTYQYHNGKVVSDAVSAVLISGPVEVDIAVSHGCQPIDIERTVTKSSANIVYEIDGRRAWDVFTQYLVGDPKNLSEADLARISIGESLPPDAASAYHPLIVRSGMGLNKEAGTVYFPAEIPVGTKLQIVRRDPISISTSVLTVGREITERHADKKPLAVFQFDCAGRGRIVLGEKTNEMTVFPLQEKIGKSVPWIGFHTYGEIAPVREKVYFHNYTVVLCTLYEA